MGARSRWGAARIAIVTVVVMGISACAPGAPVEEAVGPAVEPPPWSAERLAEDLRLIAAHGAASDLAWERGAAQGYAFLAEHSWPRAYTAETLLRCNTSDPSTTFAALDAGGFVVRASFDDPVPAPDWRFPPTDERLLDVGLRVYRVERTETVVEVDREPRVRSGLGHLAVDDEGRVLVFPACTAYLPGGRPEVERELNDRFSALGSSGLEVVCDHYRESGALAVLELLSADGFDITIVEVRTVFVDWCTPIWAARSGAPAG